MIACVLGVHFWAPPGHASTIVMIRLARRNDSTAIAGVLLDAFAEFEALYTPAGYRATTPSVAEIDARFDEGPIWVVERDAEMVGTGAVLARTNGLYVRSMAVRPTDRGLRSGEKLLDTIAAYAMQHGHRRLVLNTTPFLFAAIRLYERYGFRPTGERPDLFGTPLITMAKELT